MSLLLLEVLVINIVKFLMEITQMVDKMEFFVMEFEILGLLKELMSNTMELLTMVDSNALELLTTMEAGVVDSSGG